MLSRCFLDFSVVVGAFVIWLSQISSFFTFNPFQLVYLISLNKWGIPVDIYVILHLRIKVLNRALIDFLIIAYDNTDWIFQDIMEHPVKLMYIVFMAVLSLPVTDAYSRGAPLSACESMMPRHGSAVPQTSPPPYTITLNATSYSPNDVIEGNVWLKIELVLLCPRPHLHRTPSPSTLPRTHLMTSLKVMYD